MSDGFIFYQSFREMLDLEPDGAERLKGYEAITAYGLYGTKSDTTQFTPVVQAVLIAAVPQLDANRAKRKAGEKGGAPPGNKNAKKNKTTNG